MHKEREVVELMKAHYCIDAQNAKRLFLGADMDALVYQVNTVSQTYFVKLKYGHYDEINSSIIRFLHESGIKEVIYPIVTMDGALYKQLEHCKMIVYPFIDALDGFTQKLTQNQWIQLGQDLKIIHSLTVPISIHQHIRKENYSSKWREIVKSIYQRIERNHLDDSITADFKKFFKQNADTIKYLVTSAEELVKEVIDRPQNYVLCHSDIHAGNILIANDASLYIVDWDEPMLAPKERDLMFIGGGIGNVWNIPQEVSYFYEGYGKTEINGAILSYYRKERIIEDIAIYAQDILSQSKNESLKLISFNYFKEMFFPNGVVAIALDT